MKNKIWLTIISIAVLIFLLVFLWMIFDMNESSNPDDYIIKVSALSTIFSFFIIIVACLVLNKKENTNEIYRQKYMNNDEENDENIKPK